MKSKNGQKWIILTILFLVISIAATTIIFMDQIREFLPNDDGAISLIDEEEKKELTKKKSDGSDKESEDVLAKNSETAGEQEEGIEAEGAEASQGPSYHPGFAVSDDNGTWYKETQVEIFRIAYGENGNEITVKSNNNEMVIAPGTTNSYTFKLKNTGDVALDYTVSMEAYTSDNIDIPVETRMNRFDSTWIAGGSDKWESVPEFNGTEDNYTLGAGRYSSYTFDWQWPFESGDDEWDTYLGNLAVQEDVTLTIKITTVATVSSNPNATGGMLPDTGDDSNTMLYMILMGGAILCIFILLWFREREEDAEA